MLPYAVLMIKFEFLNKMTLECRGLEPTFSAVTFRVKKDREEEVSAQISGCEVSFLDYMNRTYHTIKLNEFQIERRKDIDDLKLDTVGFELYSPEQQFRSELLRISNDYMRYIEEKLNPDEYETGKLSGTEIAISLDTPHLWKKWIENDVDEFLKLYWWENDLENHMISTQTVTHVYIGNQFCYHLFPTDFELEQILQKAVNHHIVPVIVCSTMPEFMIDTYQKRFMNFINWMQKSSYRDKLEVVINDFGISLLIEEMGKMGNFAFTMGVLLNKRKKDSRMMISDNSQTSVNAEFYQKYLEQRFKITGISYEACGYAISFADRTCKNILHLPLYQTNTSGFCTTYAICKNGERSKQETVKKCPHYCESCQIEYVENQNIRYRFNSLFGESMKELNDFEYLRAITKNDVDRLVIRR